MTVPGNTPPPYSGTPTILVDNYVSKLNIDLVGLKPDDNQKESDIVYLEDNDLSFSAREVVIERILDLDAYHDRLFQVTSDLLLNGMGVDEVQTVYDEYEFVRDFLYQSGDTFTAQYIDYELIKLTQLLNVKSDYQSGKINLGEYYSRFSYNLIYDEINMGTENFVIACFENFFKRYPTNTELEKGKEMVDGLPVKLLLKEGRNKIDFLTIMTENSEFYQGRILDAYRTLLLRDPTSDELNELTDQFQNSDDFSTVQIEITKLDEYAGFN